MDIGALISERLTQGGFKQAAVAATVAERSRARGIERPQSTLESRLSGLKSGEHSGVLYFFSDPQLAADLMEVLQVPTDGRSVFLDAANVVLAPEERPVRLVVDLTDGPQDETFMTVCKSLYQQLLAEVPPRVELVVTASQREYLPQKYTPKGQVFIEVVDARAQGPERARKLAGENALVASTWRAPLPRWIALGWPAQGSSALVVEPGDAHESARAGRSLAGEPPVLDRDLSLVAPALEPSPPPREYAPDGPALRRLMVSLGSGGPIHPYDSDRRPMVASSPPGHRLRQGWARHLGVRAVAYPHEWVEYLVGEVRRTGSVEEVRGVAGTLRREITTVERGGRSPRVVVEGISVHVINPHAASIERIRGLQGITVHQVDARPSVGTRLRAALSGATRQSLLDDPVLARAVASVASEGGVAREIEFVAACLLASGKLAPVEAPRLRSWRAALRTILKNDPPEAGLRLPAQGSVAPHQHDPEIVVVTAHPSKADDDHGRRVSGVPAAAPLRFARGQGLVLGRPESEVVFGRAAQELPRSLDIEDSLSVYAAFERSPWRKGNDPIGDPYAARPIAIADDLWHEADRHLGVAWIALRRAARQGEAVTLHDGTGILDMGGGLVAEVSAYEVPPCPRSSPCEAELWFSLWDEKVFRCWSDCRLTGDLLLNAIASSSAIAADRTIARFHAHVPHGLSLAHEGVRAEVRFRSSPWEQATAPRRLLGAASGEAQRRAEDDYDWDD